MADNKAVTNTLGVVFIAIAIAIIVLVPAIIVTNAVIQTRIPAGFSLFQFGGDSQLKGVASVTKLDLVATGEVASVTQITLQLDNNQGDAQLSPIIMHVRKPVTIDTCTGTDMATVTIPAAKLGEALPISRPFILPTPVRVLSTEFLCILLVYNGTRIPMVNIPDSFYYVWKADFKSLTIDTLCQMVWAGTMTCVPKAIGFAYTLTGSISNVTKETVGPTASFTWSSNGLVVAFKDNTTKGTATLSSWLWAFGDSSGSVDANPSHTYSAPGNYTIVLTVTDANGLTSTAKGKVTVQVAVQNSGNDNPDETTTTTTTATPVSMALYVHLISAAMFAVGATVIIYGYVGSKILQLLLTFGISFVIWFAFSSMNLITVG